MKLGEWRKISDSDISSFHPYVKIRVILPNLKLTLSEYETTIAIPFITKDSVMRNIRERN